MDNETFKKTISSIKLVEEITLEKNHFLGKYENNYISFVVDSELDYAVEIDFFGKRDGRNWVEETPSASQMAVISAFAVQKSEELEKKITKQLRSKNTGLFI